MRTSFIQRTDVRLLRKCDEMRGSDQRLPIQASFAMSRVFLHCWHSRKSFTLLLHDTGPIETSQTAVMHDTCFPRASDRPYRTMWLDAPTMGPRSSRS